MAETQPSPSPLGADELFKKYRVCNPEQLADRCAQAYQLQPLIGGLLPQQALTLLVGDSGLGKSPLLYQAALCVAGGVPFLGMPVEQGRVLYVDAENGTGQVLDLQTRLARHLGLPKIPSDMWVHNLNDCLPTMRDFDDPLFQPMLKDMRPKLMVLDPIYALFKNFENDTQATTDAYQKLRKIMQQIGCSVIGVHHVRKTNPEHAGDLEAKGCHGWFQEARGARAIVNGSDVRLGVDQSHKHAPALVLRGFSRVTGDTPIIYLTRDIDPVDGEPVGYSRIAGVQLLSLEDQEAYAKLPDQFRFTDAVNAYGKQDQAATDFLKRCQNAGALEKLPVRAGYRKLATDADRQTKAA